MDGGTIWNANISSAIEGCLTKVDTLEQIVVDVMICTADPPPDYDPTTGNSIDEFLRKR